MTLEDADPEFINGYRSAFRFELRRDETLDQVAEGYVRDWLRSRRANVDQTALDSWDGVQDTGLPSGTQVEVIRYSDERSGRSAIRYLVTDQADKGRYRVSVSAMSVNGRGSQAALLVEVSRDSGNEDESIEATHPPRIVGDILESRDVFDGRTRLLGHPRPVRRDDIEEVLTAVADEGRMVPLLIASSVSPEADEQWREVVQQLTRTSVGTVAVFTVAADAVDPLNQSLPAALRTPLGHVRLIAPRVNMEDPVVKRHPMWYPEDIADALDSDGRPTDDGLNMFAQGPRRQLLGTALASELRRTLRLLDQEQRRKLVSKEVDERVEETQRLEELEEQGTLERTEAGAESVRRFPKRSDLYGRRGGRADFWTNFWALLARWLDQPTANVGEETVEENLRALDRRILHEREALKVNEQFLTKVEQERDDLQVEISTLVERKDSLAVQLVNTQKKLEQAEAQVGRLTEQLEELQVAPAEQPQERDQGALLWELQQKIEQKAPDAHEEVGKALRLLGERLDPLIQARFEYELGGQDWTEVLRERDLAAGRLPGDYRRNDPAHQLRMLTENLGKWGFAFEVDKLRTVSTLGQQLRSMRNRWAHHYALEAWDATRAYDAVHELLKAMGDEDGARTAQDLRDGVFLTNEVANGSFDSLLEGQFDQQLPEGSTDPSFNANDEDPAFDDPAVGDLTLGDPAADDLTGDDEPLRVPPNEEDADEDEADPVIPSESVMVRSDAAKTPLIGSGRIPYEPWEPTGELPTEYLDSTIRRADLERVRSLVEEIVDFEGPISMDRLVGLVGSEFGVSRIHDRRRRHITNQIRRSDVKVDRDGFVWPKTINPETWSQFRPTEPGVGRKFLNISPVEINNAAQFIIEDNPLLGRDEVEAEVLRTFGKKRKTKSVRTHLDKSLRDLS